MRVVPLRLKPGDELRLALKAWMGAQHEQADEHLTRRCHGWTDALHRQQGWAPEVA